MKAIDRDIRGYIAECLRRRIRQKWILTFTVLLSIAVASGVTWQLMQPAITVTAQPICGYEAHVHTTEACYQTIPACGLDANEEHQHSEACYATVLVCQLEEHTHTDTCYPEEIAEATLVPTAEPTEAPTPEPAPTEEPVLMAEPTQEATVEPTAEPVSEPTDEPTVEPTQEPEAEPVEEEPTQEPTVEPVVEEPTQEPVEEPTSEPSQEPTPEPSQEPAQEPAPTTEPTPDPRSFLRRRCLPCQQCSWKALSACWKARRVFGMLPCPVRKNSA